MFSVDLEMLGCVGFKVVVCRLLRGYEFVVIVVWLVGGRG